jgi:hypothetical protein
MTEIDYAAPAELFSGTAAQKRRAPVAYRRFSGAALAIQFAMERLDPALLKTASLEVEEGRFSGEDIQRLYASSDYPLARQAGRRGGAS